MSNNGHSFELQHINVKLLLGDPDGVDLDPVVPIFHRWIQDGVSKELLLDVADYRHVHHGPGIVLIGHEADYSVDQTDGRLGVRYNRKAVLEGSNLERMQQAVVAALKALQRLETTPDVNDKLRFNGRDVELFINDRLLAPNREDVRNTLRAAEFDAFAGKLFGGSDYSLSFGHDSRRLLSVYLQAARIHTSAELLAKLSA